MNATSRTSRRAREADAAELEIPSLMDRFAMAGQAAHPIAHAPTPQPTQPPRQHAKAPLPVGVHEGETIYEIPLDLIDVNPYNARHIYRDERVKEMAITLAADGQLQPGLATMRNGRYLLAAGHYRYRGAKVAGIPTLKVILREEMTDRQLFELSYKENNEREGQSPLDDAISWTKALADGLYATEADLSEANGISPSMINKTLAILKLPEEVLEEVKQAPNAFGLSVLYELLMFSQCAPLEQTLTLAKQIRQGEISRRDIEQARRAIQEPKQRKPREGARQYKIVGTPGQVGTIKEWDSGKVILEINFDDPAKRAELVAELCKRFGLAQAEHR